MKPKTILIVVAILALLSGLSVWLNRKTPPADEADPRVNKPLISDAVINQAVGVRITEKNKTVLLRKDGASWVDASYHDLPADFSKLARFVQDFAGTKIERFVTGNPQRIEGLELKDARVALLDASGHALVELSLGKNAEHGGRFLRYGDEAKAYLAPLNTWLDVEPKNWSDSRLTNFKPDDVEKVSLTFPEAGPVELSRAKKGDSFVAAKIPTGKRLKESAVTSLLEDLDGLRFTDTAALDDPQAAGARAHFRTVTVTTFAGETIAINLGREPEKTVVAEPEAKLATGGPEAVVGPVAGKDVEASGKEGPAKVVGGPVTKKVPAGPVFAVVSTSDSGDAVNAIMKRLAFKVADSVFTGLPEKPDDFFEPVPTPKHEKAKTPTVKPN